MRPWFFSLLLLSACSPSSCPPVEVKEWSLAEQREILAEEKNLPDDSILIPVLEDYARLRIEATR